MKPASPISQKGYRLTLLSACLAACAILAFLIPAVALFCYNWNSSAPAVTPVQKQDLALMPKAGMVADAHTIPSGLAPVANPRFGEVLADPFESFPRDLLTTAADPFMYALASGMSEGPLVVTGHDGPVPVYGPPIPRLRYRSDAEVLRTLSRLDGSFGSFFSKVFGEGLQANNLTDGPAQGETNPFRRAREASTDALPAPDTEPAATTNDAAEKPAVETTAAAEPPAQHPQDTAQTRVSNGSVDVWRPGVLMRVAEGGALETLQVSRPREDALESAEMGLRDFDLLGLPDPSELPLSVAVADFNGDGKSDAAVQTAYEGTVRFFMAQADGNFQEQMRIRVGTGSRSIAAADFNADGYMDLAISSVGTGMLTVLFGEPQNHFRFATQWIDIARTYIAANVDSQTGTMRLLGLNFAADGAVLLDFSNSAGVLSGAPIPFKSPALETTLRTATGRWPKLNAVVWNSGLSLNVDDRSGGFTNVVNVAPGADTYLVAGDLALDGNLTIAVARKR